MSGLHDVPGLVDPRRRWRCKDCNRPCRAGRTRCEACHEHQLDEDHQDAEEGR